MNKRHPETKRSEPRLRARSSWLHKQRDGLLGYRPRRLTLDLIEPADTFGACLPNNAWILDARSRGTTAAEEQQTIRERRLSAPGAIFGDEFNPDEPTCLDLRQRAHIGL